MVKIVNNPSHVFKLSLIKNCTNRPFNYILHYIKTLLIELGKYESDHYTENLLIQIINHFSTQYI